MIRIKNEQDMIDFCNEVNSSKKPFRVRVSCAQDFEKINVYSLLNNEMIEKGLIEKGSHLQQGIDFFLLNQEIELRETADEVLEVMGFK